MTKKEFIELIEDYPDNAEIVVSNYTIAFNVSCVEYHELWNQIRLSEEQAAKQMTKEYEWFGYKFMTHLMSAVNRYARDGWRLVNVVYDGKHYFAVLERDKVEKVEMKI